MSSKILIAGGVMLLIIFLVGSYFLVAGGNKPEVKVLSYSSQDKDKPVVEVKKP